MRREWGRTSFGAEPRGQRMVRVGLLGEDTGALGRQGRALDAVEDGQGGVGRQARQQHGGDVLPPPRQEPDKFVPVGLVLDAGLQRVGSGHDQQVGRVGPDGVDRQVLPGDPLGDALAPRDTVHGAPGHFDHLVLGPRLEQAEELSLGGVEGAVGHVVDQHTGPTGPLGPVGRDFGVRPRGADQPHGHYRLTSA